MPADNNDVYYFIAYPKKKTEIVDKSSWSIKDFLESSDVLCEKKTDALEAMVEFYSENDGFKHGLIVRVMKNQSADNDEYIVLDAELFEISNKKYFSTHSYRYTEHYIRLLMDDNCPLREKVEQVLSRSLSVTDLNDSDKIVAWEKVKDETNQLLVDLLHDKRTDQQTLDKKNHQLDIILQGLILTQHVLQSPTDENVKELKTFVEKEAPGKTNHWMRWGGALLAVVALAAFILSIVVTAGGSAVATGVMFPAVIVSSAGVGVSFFGQQRGLAKATNTIVEQAEIDLKSKLPGSQG